MVFIKFESSDRNGSPFVSALFIYVFDTSFAVNLAELIKTWAILPFNKGSPAIIGEVALCEAITY